jgi:Ni/Co efflux regulator RcnB
MKTKLIASALIALSMTASGSAFAQRNDHGNDRDGRNDPSYQRADDRHDSDRRDNDRYDNGRRDNGRYDNDRRDARQYHRDDQRGGGPRHDLRRGQRLNQEYRGNSYVVSDWRARHLSAPPRGHQWVQAGNDYVLAAIATGIIAQVLLSN